jgi:hypothetical protein
MKIDVLTGAPILSIFRQRLDEVVETQPETPTVVIKGDREDQSDDKQHNQHTLVPRADHQQTKEAKDEDHQFGYDHVRQNCAHEKPVFAFEKRLATGAMMPDMERAVYDCGLATGRTKQPEAAF